MLRKIAIAFLILAWGCAPATVQMDALGISAQKPSNVAVYLRVKSEAKAETQLQADAFEIYEDEQRVLPAVTRQTLLDRELGGAFRTVLLVDFSTATNESVRKEIARGVGFFVEQVLPTQAISIHAFDGRPELQGVAELTRGGKALTKAELQRIVKIEPRDPSRNLNGAVRLGLEQLDKLLAGKDRRVPVGTLVVFTGGPDLAGRVSESDAQRALEASPHAVITIAVATSERQGSALREGTRDAFVNAHDLETFSLAFEEAAHIVKDEYHRHYLLAYCSPARAGVRRLRLDLPFGEGDREELGSVVEEFNADGFTAGCDPSAAPSFARPEPKPKPN